MSSATLFIGIGTGEFADDKVYLNNWCYIHNQVNGDKPDVICKFQTDFL